jgi:hypothetical protein
MRARGEQACGNAEEMRESLENAELWIERSGAAGLAPQVVELRARLAGMEGASEEPGLREALAAYEAIGARGHAARLRGELG